MKNNAPALCVIGAGPAGLALALRAADNGTQVTLVDAGGPGIEATAPSLHAGGISEAIHAADRTDERLVGGHLYRSDHLEATRWRHPGGSSWRWGASARPGGRPSVRMVQAAPIDFAARPRFDIPGFPLDAEDVLRYSDDTLGFLGLPGHTFDVDNYRDDHAPVALDPSRFYDKLFHFPFAEAVRTDRVADVLAHPLIELRTGLHLVGFGRTGSRLSHVEFTNDQRRVTRMHPERLVLAIGGVENARQLLLGAAEGSIPDPHDQLGRYFMDHPHLRLGYLPEADPDALTYYDFQHVNGATVLRGHGIRPDVAERDHLLRFSIDLVGRHPLDSTRTGFALASAMDAARRRQPRSFARHFSQAMRRPADAARLVMAARGGVHHTGAGGWSDPSQRLHDVGVVSVESMFEQRPSPDNRIRLRPQTDRYGLSQPTIQWSFSQQEVDGIRRAVKVTSDAFEAAGLGRLRTMADLGDAPIPRAGTGLHHLGGTRMHVDPTEGVVDSSSRHHQLDNLYITGSSVFPTSVGYANPTFTVIQMAMLLADQLTGTKFTPTEGLPPAPPRSAPVAAEPRPAAD